VSRPLRVEYPGAFYHVTSRGNERKMVFQNTRDRERYLSYLESAHERYGAIVHGYCLMGNHYHLLLETPRGNLSQIIHHIMEPIQPTLISNGIAPGIFSRGDLRGYSLRRMLIARSCLDIFI